MNDSAPDFVVIGEGTSVTPANTAQLREDNQGMQFGFEGI
jgi:hypothetical protein